MFSHNVISGLSDKSGAALLRAPAPVLDGAQARETPVQSWPRDPMRSAFLKMLVADETQIKSSTDGPVVQSAIANTEVDDALEVVVEDRLSADPNVPQETVGMGDSGTSIKEISPEPLKPLGILALDSGKKTYLQPAASGAEVAQAMDGETTGLGDKAGLPLQPLNKATTGQIVSAQMSAPVPSTELRAARIANPPAQDSIIWQETPNSRGDISTRSAQSSATSTPSDVIISSPSSPDHRYHGQTDLEEQSTTSVASRTQPPMVETPVERGTAQKSEPLHFSPDALPKTETSQMVKAKMPNDRNPSVAEDASLPKQVILQSLSRSTRHGSAHQAPFGPQVLNTRNSVQHELGQTSVSASVIKKNGSNGNDNIPLSSPSKGRTHRETAPIAAPFAPFLAHSNTQISKIEDAFQSQESLSPSGIYDGAAKVRRQTSGTVAGAFGTDSFGTGSNVQQPETMETQPPHPVDKPLSILQAEAKPYPSASIPPSTEQLIHNPSPDSALRTMTAPLNGVDQQVIRQMLYIIERNRDGSIRVALDPPELGSVAMRVQGTGDTLSIVLMGERGETTDLLRRNLEPLAQELSRLGYGSVDIDLADRRRRQAEPPAPHTEASAANNDDGNEETKPMPQRKLSTEQGLDLRL